MITTEIPKRIIDKITANEMNLYRCVTIGTVRRYSYFAYEGGKLWLEVVAVKWFKKGKQYCKTPDELEKYAIFIRKVASFEVEGGGFMVILAESKQQLIVEGKLLHHCVGSMDYDQRIARETSLIAFIRRVNEPTVPFVTVELSLKDNAVKQCYGDHDSKPSEDVRQFVYEVWQPYANKKIKELKKAG